MLVSNFELLILPREDQRTFQETSYELVITNLEAIGIQFLMEMHASIYVLRDDPAYLADLYVEILFDDGNWETPVYRNELEMIRPVYIVIPSKATVVVKINPPVEREITGYITLRVPPVRTRSHLLITTQQASPVNVLLAASRQDFCRSFVDDIRDENNRPVYKIVTNSWLSRQCIPLASGKALTEIEPEGIGLRTKVSEVLDYLPLIEAIQQSTTQSTAEEDANLQPPN